MNKEELQLTIKQIKDSQARYNREVGELIGKLERACITDADDHSEPREISIGGKVRILNLNRFGGKEGVVVKITSSRVTVSTSKGKVVRAHRNVEALD